MNQVESGRERASDPVDQSFAGRKKSEGGRKKKRECIIQAWKLRLISARLTAPTGKSFVGALRN